MNNISDCILTAGGQRGLRLVCLVTAIDGLVEGDRTRLAMGRLVIEVMLEHNHRSTIRPLFGLP